MPTTIQPIAAQVSAPKPLHGQDNRSSDNFQFLALPSHGDITASMPSSITCAIMQDVSGGRDPVVTTLSNGGSFSVSKVSKKDNYYLASPSGTSRAA